MYRINATTGEKFKHGDLRNDGYMFERYLNTVDKNGIFREQWRSPKAVQNKKNANKSYFTTKDGRIANILSVIKVRARLKNIPFNLTFEYIKSIAPDNCPVFNFPLAWERESTGKPQGSKFDSPSLDRIVPKLGYVEGNVVWLSMKANSIKSNGTHEDLTKVAEWLKTL